MLSPIPGGSGRVAEPPIIVLAVCYSSSPRSCPSRPVATLTRQLGSIRTTTFPTAASASAAGSG